MENPPARGRGGRGPAGPPTPLLKHDAQILSDDALRTFRMSVARFIDATRDAKVDVLLQNHMLMDPIQPMLDAVAARTSGQSNPFVVGRSKYQKLLKVMDGCTEINLKRRRKSVG